jgi:invasion protein IalB
MTARQAQMSAAGIRSAAAVAAIVIGLGGALAQDTTQPPAAAPAPAAPAPAAPALDGTTPPAATVEIPQPEWEKVCGTVNEEQECHISRRRLAATGQPIAQAMIIERGDRRLLQVAVPPVALIQPGLQVKVDESEPSGVRYVVCTPGECLALGEIDQAFIDGLKRGGTLLITMLNPEGRPVTFDISLVGFTSAYDGPGIDPAQAQANQQRLEEELRRKADEARQQLLQLQQQQPPATP